VIEPGQINGVWRLYQRQQLLNGIHGRLDGNCGRFDLLQCAVLSILCAGMQKPAYDFAAEGTAALIRLTREVPE
jgi:hypothetical protein